MSSTPLDLRYGAEALALVCIAWGVIKWVGRNVRESQGETAAPRDPIGLSEGVARQATEALRVRGLVSSQSLAGMSERERAFMLSMVAAQIGEPSATASSDERSRTRQIADAPVGRRVHCPACGEALDRAQLVRLGEVECRGCASVLRGHVQRGRLTLVVEDEREPAARED